MTKLRYKKRTDGKLNLCSRVYQTDSLFNEKKLNVNITGVDLFPREDSLYSEILPLEKLDATLKTADIVVLTLPLTEQTRHLINDSRFSLLKDGAVLVNIARGAVVDTEALLNHIDRLGGAVLDVFEEEPLDDSSPLWDKENIILTPHNSFVGEVNGERLRDDILVNL